MSRDKYCRFCDTIQIIFPSCPPRAESQRRKIGWQDLKISACLHKVAAKIYRVSDWIRFGDSEYLFPNPEKTWADAKATCQSYGADLTSIRSQQEQDFIYEHMQTL